MARWLFSFNRLIARSHFQASLPQSISASLKPSPAQKKETTRGHNIPRGFFAFENTEERPVTDDDKRFLGVCTTALGAWLQDINTPAMQGTYDALPQRNKHEKRNQKESSAPR